MLQAYPNHIPSMPNKMSQTSHKNNINMPYAIIRTKHTSLELLGNSVNVTNPSPILNTEYAPTIVIFPPSYMYTRRPFLKTRKKRTAMPRWSVLNMAKIPKNADYAEKSIHELHHIHIRNRKMIQIRNRNWCGPAPRTVTKCPLLVPSIEYVP